jgi:hypothetical protein
MIRLLLPLTAVLLTAGPTAHGKPNHPATPRVVTSPKETPRPSTQDEAAMQIRWMLQRVRGEGHAVVFPPPEIWLPSSERH